MNDQQFLGSALGVLGALVALTIIIIVVANVVVDDPDELAPEQLALIEERLQPPATVVTDPDALIRTAAVSSEPLSAEQINSQYCAACHAAGVLGAPKTGDADAWGARLSDKGRQMLVSNAINGINQMPARGGNPDLSDEDIAKTVEYMLGEAGL